MSYQLAESPKERSTQRSIKIHRGTEYRSHLATPLPKVEIKIDMANQEKGKNKGPVSQVEEVASGGKLGLGTRLLEHGGPSNGGDSAHTPVWQGGPASQRARYGGSGDAVAPIFPVSMEAQPPHVVSLDLSKERAAMRSRWLAIGLFFSVQLFGVGGLF